jgi:hypothetical protein
MEKKEEEGTRLMVFDWLTLEEMIWAFAFVFVFGKQKKWGEKKGCAITHPQWTSDLGIFGTNMKKKKGENANGINWVEWTWEQKTKYQKKPLGMKMSIEYLRPGGLK